MTVPVRQAPLRLRLGLLALALILLLSALLIFLSPGWTRARPLGTIYRPLSSADRALSHCPRPDRAGIGMGRKKSPLPPPALLRRFPMGAGDVEQPGGSHPGMVPGTERRILRTAGYPAHVGRSIGCGRLLALLDVARILSRVRDFAYPWPCWSRLGWCRGRDIAAASYRKVKIT